MKTILTILIGILLSLQLKGQTMEWAKSDRNVLFDEYNSFLVQYKNLTSEQRESISLCCLDETTKSYTKAQYNAKIDIEIKRIKEATIIQCAKNMGIELRKTETEITKNEVSTEPVNWTKEDKSKLAKSANDLLEDYQHISLSDKEKIALCFIEEITTNKTKQDYESLIEIELRQLKTATISKCSKKLGVNLEAPVKTEVKVEKNMREQIIGTWKTDQDCSIIFNENGTCIRTFKEDYWTPRFTQIEGNVVNGEWFIDEKGILTLKENWIEIEAKLLTTKRYSGNESNKYNFVNYSNNYFKMELIEGNNQFGSSSNGSGLVIQANRVK
jgi:hypothetical protein